jgi:Uma2 family endonuclease
MATDITQGDFADFDPEFVPNAIPELEQGDRLTRAEFERRYEAMPNLKKAELIRGVVYMPSPVRRRRHGRPHARFIHWLMGYEEGTPGVEAAANTSDRLDEENEPQPDAMLYVLPEFGGQVRFSKDDYVEGGPELAGEIASSSASYDLGPKMDVYREHGVKEYVVWRVLQRAIDWFVLRRGKYERLQPGPDGILRSEVFPGLWLDAAATMRGDLPRVMQVLRDGLQSEQHAEFVARLHQAKQKKPGRWKSGGKTRKPDPS